MKKENEKRVEVLEKTNEESEKGVFDFSELSLEEMLKLESYLKKLSEKTPNDEETREFEEYWQSIADRIKYY